MLALSFDKLIRHMRDRQQIKAVWLFAPGILFLAAFLIGPLAQLLLICFRDPASGNLSIDVFQQLVASPVYLQVLRTTFTIALETTLLTLLIAYPLAAWLAAMPTRRRRMAILLILLPFWTSALVKNFAWMILLGRNGIATAALAWLGVSEPVDILFTHGVVVFAMVHTLLPMATLIILPSMLQIDTRLVAVAATLGANPAHRFWRIYFPLSMPGVAGAGLLVFVISLGFFITPALLGSPRETLLGQVIITQILGLQNWSLGAAISVLLTVSTLIVCLIYNRLFGLTDISDSANSERRKTSGALGLTLLRTLSRCTEIFTTLQIAGGKYGLPAKLRTLYATLVVIILLLPIFAVLPMSFTTSSFLSFPPPLFSFKWLNAYFSSPIWMAATLRSFAIGLASATLTFLIAFPAAYGSAVHGGRLARFTFSLFLVPMIVPHIVVSLSLFYLFSQISLVATDMGIAIGHTVLAIPTVYIVCLAAMKRHDWSLAHAAASLGANRWKTVVRIHIPLMKSGLFAAFIFGFLLSFEELTVAMFIGGGLKTTLPKQMWDDILLQLNPTLAAASTFVLAVVMSFFFLAENMRRTSGASGQAAKDDDEFRYARVRNIPPTELQRLAVQNNAKGGHK